MAEFADKLSGGTSSLRVQSHHSANVQIVGLRGLVPPCARTVKRLNLSGKLPPCPRIESASSVETAVNRKELSMPNWNHISDDRRSCQVISEDQTNDLGHQIAANLKPGDVVALVGELGAGKTRFVKAVAQACGVPVDEVNSPTFTLIHEYEGRVLIRHCDTYRLRSPEEFADLGLDELFAPDGIALVEWADRVEEYLPRDRLEIRFTIDSPTARTMTIAATGKRSREILARLSE